MVEEEIWRPVPSHPQFEASSLGRIRTEVTKHTMPGGGDYYRGGKPTLGCWDGIRFIYQFRRKTYRVHRLVCEAFHGPAPADKPKCLHLDENGGNNLPGNLRWGTQKENLNFPGYLAYCKARLGDSSPTTKHRSQKAKEAEIRERYAQEVRAVFNC